jgi:hypothetical protein
VTSLVLAAPEISALFMGEEFVEDKIWSDDHYAIRALLRRLQRQTADDCMRFGDR